MKYTISKYQQVYYVLQKPLRLDFSGFLDMRKPPEFFKPVHQWEK
jgi:hypothetical protein